MWVLKPDAKGSTSEEIDTLARLRRELLAAEKSILLAKSTLEGAKFSVYRGNTGVFRSGWLGACWQCRGWLAENGARAARVSRNQSVPQCLESLLSQFSQRNLFHQLLSPVETHHAATGPSALERLENTDDCHVVSLCTTYCQMPKPSILCNMRKSYRSVN